MAGIGQPAFLGKLTKMIKDKHPEIIIEYHGHSGPGLSMASMLEVAKNGADILDVAIEPLSWGMVHPDLISVQSMLKNAGFDVPEINMDAYMKARAMTQEFIDEWLGYFINPKNKISQFSASRLRPSWRYDGFYDGRPRRYFTPLSTTFARRKANQNFLWTICW